ncbi:hypothetical protein [Nonomuraea jiangxiensis]|uniref:DUF4351 domain-containing protein n=1 Tax=Nonomuraea jiangxiensis TaxID=633440 RepID=A0A1G8HET7_9ACTN|nr:hypothetical protein [Nonomuraea jiangxiensis]SDI04980.1 hypothetical protein SAMN05421869_104145 [Nonomuraea jiangxiensis]
MPPSLDHEIPLEMLRRRPDLGLELLIRALDAHGDGYSDAREESAGGSHPVHGPIISVKGPDGERRQLIIEIRRRYEPERLWAWIGHVGALMARERCGVILLVVCPDEASAAEYRKGIQPADSYLPFAPLVLGPERMPRIQDPEEIRAFPELATLCAAAHADDLDTVRAVAKALIAGDEDYGLFYYDYLRTQLSDEIRTKVEDAMIDLNQRLPDRFTKPLEDAAEARGEARGEKRGRSHGMAQGMVIGEVQGQIRSLLSVLEARGLKVDEKHRDVIDTCADRHRLTAWIFEAATAETADEIFEAAT